MEEDSNSNAFPLEMLFPLSPLAAFSGPTLPPPASSRRELWQRCAAAWSRYRRRLAPLPPPPLEVVDLGAHATHGECEGGKRRRRSPEDELPGDLGDDIETLFGVGRVVSEEY